MSSGLSPAARLGTFVNAIQRKGLGKPPGDARRVPEPVRPRPIKLNHGRIAKNIADEAGQSITFSIEETKAGGGFIKQGASQGQGAFHSFFGPSIIEGLPLLYGTHPEGQWTPGIIKTAGYFAPFLFV
jgi:hypothetical protein